MRKYNQNYTTRRSIHSRCAQTILKAVLFLLLFSLVFASVLAVVTNVELFGSGENGTFSNIADAATDVSATTTTTYTLGFTNFTQVTSDSSHTKALATNDSGKGFQFNCNGHILAGSCDTNVVAYAKVNIGTALRSSDVVMTFSVENTSNGGNSDKWGIAITSGVPTVSGIGDSAFSPANTLGKSSWNEVEKVEKNCDAVLSASTSVVYVGVYGNSDQTLEMFFSNIKISFTKPAKSLTSLTTSLSSFSASSFIFNYTVGSYTGGPDRKTSRTGETVGIYGSGANDATGVLYTPINITSTLLNHLNAGATINLKLSVTNVSNGGDSDKWGIAITSSIPTVSGVSDGAFNPSNTIAKSAWNQSANDTKTCSGKLTVSKVYIAIYSNSDSDWDIGWNNIKLEIESYSYKYTVNFTSGGNGTLSTTTDYIVGDSTATTKETPATCTATANTGYHFVNWTKGTTTTQQSTSATLSVTSSMYFSYSSYKANFASNVGTITYNANGGTGSKSQSISYDSTFTIDSGDGFARTDYILVGWATSSTAVNATYTLGQTGVTAKSGDFSLANENNKTFVLYAVWKQSDYGVLSGLSKTDGTWGSADNPFVIENAQHLFNLSNIVNGGNPTDSVTGKSFMSVTTAASDIRYTGCYFVLSTDIDMSTSTWKDKFQPIGNGTSYYFSGTFYGGVGDYDGIKQTRQVKLDLNSTSNYVGLFGYVNGGRVENITVTGAVSGASYVGGLVGYLNKSSVDNCTNQATVAAGAATSYSGTNAGGIVGYSIGLCQITNCRNEGNVDGDSGLGGIIGFTNGPMTLTDCVSTGKIEGHHGTSGEGAVGGIVGRLNDSLVIENCTFDGIVLSNANGAGGILGFTATNNYSSARIIGCNVFGAISGGINVGGIAGRLGTTNVSNDLIIEYCYNAASISQTNASSTGTVGGIVGYFHVNGANQNAKIFSCVNAGSVSCSDKNSGGIVGNANAENGGAISIEYCYNLGTVSNGTSQGGIAGTVTGAAVSNSWNFYQGARNAYGSHLWVASSINNAFYPAVSESDISSTDWSLVTNGTVYRAFRIFASGYTVANGSYMRIYSDLSNYVTPSLMTVEETSSAASAAVRVSNAMFDSAIKDSAGNAINILSITTFSISTKTKSITNSFRDTPAVADDWLLLSANLYASARKVFYLDGGTFTETVPTDASAYDVKLSLYNGEYLIGNCAAKYTVEQIDISKQTQSGVFDLPFGYVSGGIAANGFIGNIGGVSYYQLERKADGTLFAESESPYYTVFKDSNSYYSKLVSYNLVHAYSGTGGATLYHNLDETELSFALNVGSVNGDEFEFPAGAVLSVVMTLNGIGNYKGTRTIRFTLMDSDFGGNYTQSNWGSEANPYLIEHEAHLIRLGQIVAGAQAWNSINSQDKSVAAEANSAAVATDRSYSGAYFFLAEDLNASSGVGFKPIGQNAQNAFSATFNGEYGGSVHTVTLNISANGSDYVGLFGYLKGAKLVNVSVAGSVSGRDYVGGIAGYADGNTVFDGTTSGGASVTGRRFVGGILGSLDASLENAATSSDSTVTGNRAVGGLVGYLNGSITDCVNQAEVVYSTAVTVAATDLFRVVESDGKTLTFHAIGGLVGVIRSTGAQINYCENHGRVTGGTADGVGGIVGFASADGSINIYSEPDSDNSEGRKIYNNSPVIGRNYVGGIVGYGNNVSISDGCVNEASITATGNYAGGIAGKWIVYDGSQVLGQRRVQGGITITGDTYVGGLAGWFDGKAAKGLQLTLYITNGEAAAVTVSGKSYVGAMYGGFEGYGYKRNSQTESEDDTAIYLTPDNAPGTANPQIYVKMSVKAGGRVVGGIIGYASGVGVMLLGNWSGYDHTPFTFEGNTSFVGGLVGVLGENATIGSAETLASGGYSVYTEAHTVQYRSLVKSGGITFAAGGDFVGSIVGYIASTAGIYQSSGSTVMGNTLQLVNRSTVSGGSFVGGIFGALGRVSGGDYQVSGDEKLSHLLLYGKYDTTTERAVNNTLRYAPADGYGNIDARGLGRLYNYSAITGRGDYVGGIVGYAGDGALLAFVNASIEEKPDGFNISDITTYLNVYSGYNSNPSSGSTANITGANYVGGIVGRLSSSLHEFTHVVSLMRVIGNGASSEAGSNVGGIAGYMAGGTLDGCIATSGFTTSTNGVNAFRGGTNVGGLVGMLEGGTVKGSVSRGFSFDKVNSTRGGVVGSVGAGTTISASWTVYIVSGSGLTNGNITPNYSTVSLNSNGKYIIVDSRLLAANMVPTYYEYARMVGLFGEGVELASGNMQATDSADGVNKAKEGYLSFKTWLPSEERNLKNTQLVFYNVSGADKNTDNTMDAMSSEVVFDNLIAKNGQIFYRIDMAQANSFSICVVPVVFKNVPTCTSTNEETQKSNAANAYQKPASQDTRYSAEVTVAQYDTVTHNLIQLRANIMYENVKGDPQIVGTYVNDDIQVGSSEAPYIISSQADWNLLAENVNGTKNNIDLTKVRYIKLATDSVLVTGSSNYPFMGASTSNYFSGTFDGDGHRIRISVSGSSNAGISVFPFAGNAVIRNLTITGTISTSAENAAGFATRPTGKLEFYNCTNETNITAKRTAGGIVGYTNGQTIKLVSCVNKGRIETDDPIESDADHSGKDSMYGSSNKYYKALPDFNNYTYGTGGIIGYATNTITIESCKNEGYIRAGYNVGGIIGQNDAETHIYNCANTGEILGDAYWTDESAYLKEYGGGTYRMVYAGGIVGKIGQHGWLEMLACYNSGAITGWGPVVGGLAGSVGYLLMDGADTGIAGGKSTIAYCYNTGEVKSGGSQRLRQNEDEHSSQFWTSGREELNGSIVGGIVGFIAWGDINYCYNIGQITTFRIIGYAWVWQSRIGGIAGQAQPSASNYYVNFNYCYNLGLLYVYSRERNGYLDAVGDLPYWGGGICGYLDKNDCQDRLTSSYCYTIENFMHAVDVQRNTDDWASDSIKSIGSSDTKRYVIGTLVSDVKQLTAYMSSGGSLMVNRYIGTSTDAANQAASLIDRNGNYQAQYNENTESVTYSSEFRAGTAYGYMYIYGCLPQLAVFALDTKEGLSMLSVSYGKNEYDEYVGSIAGSKESPYVIKDGIGLLAMSALTGARSNAGSGSGYGYFTFKDKYIEFADGANNIEGITAKAINMSIASNSTSMKSSSTSNGSYNQNGKNYFLWQQGAASGLTSFIYNSSTTSSTLRTEWWNTNNYYRTSGGYTTGYVASATSNFYPIGRTGGASSFMGNMSGLQSDGSNTEIRGLQISQYNASNSYAGLFGSIYDATVSNISVSGSVRAYTSLVGGNSFAGGIAGYAGGNSKIENCIAGTSSQLYVYAYANNSSEVAPTGKMFAGGIVGAAGPKRNSGFTDTTQKRLEISGCNMLYANVTTAKSNAGGIVGYVGDPWSNSNVEGNYITVSDSTVTRGNIGGVDKSEATNIGGVVGVNDGKVVFSVTNATVGNGSSVYLYIKGKNSVGGVIGTSNGRMELGGINIASNTRISRQYLATDSSDVVSNADGIKFTSIGGVIGRTEDGKDTTLKDVITFNGRIEIAAPTTGSNASTGANPVANIGGVIGYMGEGSAFAGGSIVTVGGTITIDGKNGTVFRINNARNVGGVVGATVDGAFDGYFDIRPTINSTNATNVGGFIGRNFGETNIISSKNTVTVDGKQYTGTVVNINGRINGKSEVGGLVGINGYLYPDGNAGGNLRIGADDVSGTIYDGSVVIVVGGKYKGDSAAGLLGSDMFDIVSDTSISATENNVGGIVGSNIVSGEDLGLLIRKGIIYNFATVGGADNIGGVVGNNAGDIVMGGSKYTDAVLMIVNGGNVTGENHIGGTIGYLQLGSIAGIFANIGNVEGKQYVGGSIGRVDSEAVLTAVTSDTYFYNGEDTYADGQTDALVAAEGVVGAAGNVIGEKYVGGSIGAMFGTIEGVSPYGVRFYNIGNVTGKNGANYVGGNIGMLAGTVGNADFANSGSVTSDGNTAIGGSVGIIGKDSAITDIDFKTISLVGAHFDFTGDKNISVTGTSSGEGGIGGAVGIIGDISNGFDNSDGSKWSRVTLYTANGVSAPMLNNVGGAIGLIKADNILINNMLAFYTSVTGSVNVGGIVGAVTGHNVKVLDSFNIEGEVHGTTAGGIIGSAIAGDTDASTSYWVKGYTNEELMALSIDSIVEQLGKYEVAKLGNTVFTEELTTDYGTVANFLNDDTDKRSWAEYIEDVTGHAVQLVNGVYAYDRGTQAIYTTGAAEGHTGWYYLYANNRAGLDTVHTDADPDLPSAKLPVGEARDRELAYWKRIANAYTAQELEQQMNKMLLVSGIVAKIEGETVTGSPDMPTVGTEVVPDEENAYAPISGYIYASALASTVSGYYLYMDATGEKPTIWHGTNADGSQNADAPFYITANTHTAKNVAVYYRAVSVGGTLTYNGYNRYVPVTDEVSRITNGDGTTTVQRIEYHANFDDTASGNPGDYAYTMNEVRTKDGALVSADELYKAGTYLIDVSIYYYDAFGKPAKIGGISSDPNTDLDDDKLRINKLNLDITLAKENGQYAGKDTGGWVTMTVLGISARDVEIDRSILLNIIGGTINQGGTIDNFIYDGKEEIEAKFDLVALYKAIGTHFGYENADSSRTLYPLNTTRMYLSDIVEANNSFELENKNISDENPDLQSRGVVITFRFTDSFLNGAIEAALAGENEGVSTRNYKDNAEDAKQKAIFTVTPRELKINNTATTKTFAFNGGYQNPMQFNFVGWVDDDERNSSQFIAELMPKAVYIPSNGANVEKNMYNAGSNPTMTSPVTTDKFTLTWSTNGSIVLADRLRDLGTYQINFDTETRVYLEDLGITGGTVVSLPATKNKNYYLSADSIKKGTGVYSDSFIYEYCYIVPNELALEWDEDPNVTYNARTHEFGLDVHVVSNPSLGDTDFTSPEALEEEIKTLFGSDFDYPYTVTATDNKTARVVFVMGPNVKVGGYNVTLPRAETDNCGIADGSELTGVFTILPLNISVKLDGNTEAVYNGGFHEIEGGITVTTADPDAEPRVSFNDATGAYTLTLYSNIATSAQSPEDNRVTVLLAYVKEDGTTADLAVNVGEYGAKIGSVRGSNNFNITYDATGGGSIVITPAGITLEWDGANSWTYDAKSHGRGINGKLTQSINGMSLVSTYTLSSAKAQLTITNAFGGTEIITVPLSGTPSAINAGSYVANVNMSAISISGQNAAGEIASAQLDENGVLGNYVIAFAGGHSATSGNYIIRQRQVSVTAMYGNNVVKIYDATNKVASSSVGDPRFNDSLAPSIANCTVSAVYDNANVGTGKTITYTITITGADRNNFDFTNGTDTMKFSVSTGVINARGLVVSVNRLRNGAATRVYNGDVWYGGQNGAVSVAGSTTATSEISRSGEGFTVSNIAQSDLDGAVVITAVYAEATAGRSMFDRYINNVVGSGVDIALGTALYGDSDYYYKKLVFTLSGAAASNYRFDVYVGSSTNIGDRQGSAGANGVVTVNDVRNGGVGGIKIEITPYTLKAEYSNTAQSYANADNTYNVDWLPVRGDADGVRSDDVLRVDIENNWMYENNNESGAMIPARYTSYTVIRGAVNSKALSAKLGSSNGVHINYQLSNQPVLTIGYFIDREEFEIGSIASLMIATYYYAVGKGGGSEFGEIISQAYWQSVATVAEYVSGAGYPTSNNGQPFLDDDGNEIIIASWDDYFEWLETEAGGRRYVFLNESEGDGEWGYYYVDENSLPKSYDKFKQIANVSGVFTAEDIAILNGMFKRTTLDGDGNVIEENSYDWGVGGEYLTNFIKMGVGNVVTAIGGVFVGSFGGAYDGNGYTIDTLNIIGTASGDGYFGMFGRIASDGTETANVTNVHLRNVNITVGGAGNVYVGGIAGDSAQANISNVSVHGKISVNVTGNAYVGGLFGLATTAVDGAIALGNMEVRAASANVGGIVGRLSGAKASNAISLMQISVVGGANVGGLIGDGATVDGVGEYMRNAVWNNGTVIAGGKTYSELFAGSVSGYGDSKYYYEETANAKGVYDVLDDLHITALDGDEISKTNAHESMRLADIIDLYVLLYAKIDASVTVEGKAVSVFDKSEKSALIGNSHGTDESPIVIANQQGIALLRELRFATFTLANDVHMYSTYTLSTAKGVFFGKILANGYSIYIRTWDGSATVFEKEVATDAEYTTPTGVLKSK